jgi:hypothetical protein
MAMIAMTTSNSIKVNPLRIRDTSKMDSPAHALWYFDEE